MNKEEEETKFENYSFEILMRFKIYYILTFLLLGIGLNGQSAIMPEDTIKEEVDSSFTIDPYDDPLLRRDLDEIYVTSPRKFKTNEDYRKYLRYKRYAVVVYP
ncbi:MAG: hypothetical protein AAGK97_06985, partial [Bacteroidota bacterium]